MLRLARWIPEADFDSWFTTLHSQLLAEVDYPREQRMAQAMAEGLSYMRRYNSPGDHTRAAVLAGACLQTS